VKRIIILRSNPVAPDPRVEKVADWLHHDGWTVTVFAWDRGGNVAAVETRAFGTIHRVCLRAPFGAGLRNVPRKLGWNLRLLCALFRRAREYTFLHACDFDTLLPALLLKVVLGKRVVYDVFDFFADGLPPDSRTGRLLRKLDLWSMGLADAVLIADDSRRDQIRGARPKRLEVVYNTPRPPGTAPATERAVTPPGGLRLAFIGVLYRNRGLLEMLSVLRHHPEWSLDLAGFGGDEELIVDAAAALPNVRFHGAVPYDRTLQLSAEADALFALYDPTVPNHRYSSPNKLFESMMLGKPIIVANGTGMDRVVREHRLGYTVEYGDEGQLEAALSRVAGWDVPRRQSFAEHARSVYERHFSASEMERRVCTLYASLLTEGRPG